MDNVAKETHAVSIMTKLPLTTVAVIKDQKDDRFLPHPTRRQSRLTGEKSNKEENSDKRSQILCRYKKCKNPSCKFWHLPVRQNYKSEKGCAYGDRRHFRRVEAEGKPNKKSKKGCAKGSVAILKESFQLGCVSQDSCPRTSIQREPGRLGSKHAAKFSKGTWHQIKIRERTGPSRGVIQQCASHGRSLCAPSFEERSHEETLHQEGCARKAAWDLAKNIYKLHNSGKATLDTLFEARVMPAPTSKSPEEREFVVDSGASMHMMSKKE